MTAIDPLAADSRDVSSWTGNDVALVADYIVALTDGDTSTNVVDVGSDPDDCLKITFSGFSTAKSGDTISVWVTQLTTFATMAMLAYDTPSGVTTTSKITLTPQVGENIFTLTSGFLSQLFAAGGGGGGLWSIRIVEDGGISGSAGIAEVGGNLSGGGGGSPGGTPGNAPDNYKYLKNHRLANNSSIARMPQGQREWSAFIHELQKWIKDETGTFDISSSDTAKFTGFSTDPTTSSIWWHRYGQFVHLEFNIGTGTSDTTAFTVTNIPAVIRPRDDCTYPLFGLYDNGAAIADRGSVKIGSDGTLTFYTDQQDGTWTAGATTKGFEAGLGAKGLIYGLRSPDKQ